MAIGESRGAAKEAAHAAGGKTWAFSTGKIHSYKTRQVYQEHAIRFSKWARATYGVKQFAELQARADELANEYLRKQLDEQKSAFTLQTIRAALRMLFGNRQLAQEVELPKRLRRTIKRSRGRKLMIVTSNRRIGRTCSTFSKQQACDAMRSRCSR